MKKDFEFFKNNILGRQKKDSSLIDVMELIYELKCLPEIIGRDFEVRDADDKLIYTIRQKSISVKQLNVFLEQLNNVFERKNQREKDGTKKNRIKKR